MRSVVLGLSLVVASACVTVAGVGCSAPAPAETLSAGDTSAAIQIYFPVGYSAVDNGAHDFKLPAIVTGVSGIKWSVSDPSLMDLEPNADGTQVMMTMKGAGVVTLIATAGSLKGTAQINIRQADPAEYDNGKARYTNGVTIQPGGFRHPDPTLQCTNCHAPGGMDVEHTPMQTGGYSDQDLVNIMTTGTKPPGVAQRVMPFAKWHALHQWKMTDDEKNGLVTYLRSLEPQSQGPIDFGGHGPGGGGHRDGGGAPDDQGDAGK
jgi:hypothetical protein